MKTMRTTLATALFLSIAAPFAYGQDPAGQLAQCVKMPPGSPEQNVCIATVQTQAAVMKAQAAAAQAAATAQAAAAAQAQAAEKAKPGAKSDPATGVKKAPDAPPDVKKAAQQLGLAGSPPQGLPGAAPLPPVNISGMDIKSAMAALKQQQAALIQAHLNSQIPAMQKQAAALAAQEAAAAKIKEAQGSMKGSITQGAVSIGSGAAGLQAIANMKNAGLDTSKISTTNVKGVANYEMSEKQADAYQKQLEAQKKQGAAEQQKQAETLQALLAQNKQSADILQKYLDAIAAAQAQIVGNVH